MRPPSARSISAAWILSGQRAAREFGERPGKRGFGRNLRASLPAEDATQGLVDGEALDQGAGGGNAKDRLGHESSGEGATVLGRPARPPGRLGNEGFEADHVERGDETTQRFGDRNRRPRASRGTKSPGCSSSEPSSRREGRPSCLQLRLKRITFYDNSATPEPQSQSIPIQHLKTTTTSIIITALLETEFVNLFARGSTASRATSLRAPFENYSCFGFGHPAYVAE